MKKTEKFMRRALNLAKRGKGLTSPNPAVGAVIVYKNKIIGEGFHKYAGGPHAEVEAVKSADPEKLSKSEIYVTLEPCSHYGKTPPCTDLIIKSEIKKVYIGSRDPNPLVDGLTNLKKHGVKIETGLLKDETDSLNEDFFYYIKTGKPFVTVKCAITLDGKIATCTGDSKWISNEKARRFAHHLRKINSAMIIGTNTILKDNPYLNIRTVKSRKKNTNLFILDSKLQIPLNYNVFKNNPADKIFIVTSTKNRKMKILNQYYARKLNIVFVRMKNEKLDMEQLINKKIKEMGLFSVLIEGGAGLIGNIFEKSLVNKIHFIYGNTILGGQNSLSCVVNKDRRYIKNGISIDNIVLKKFDNNFMVTGYVHGNN